MITEFRFKTLLTHLVVATVWTTIIIQNHLYWNVWSGLIYVNIVSNLVSVYRDINYLETHIYKITHMLTKNRTFWLLIYFVALASAVFTAGMIFLVTGKTLEGLIVFTLSFILWYMAYLHYNQLNIYLETWLKFEQHNKD